MKSNYLEETDYINFSHPAVLNYVAKVNGDSAKEKAISIYYLVRDSIRYNPYTVKFGTACLKASFGAEKLEAYCIPKAALMVALCRYFKIPAKIGLADVKNHLSSEKLTQKIGSDYFAMHGYAEILLDDKWLKCTPIFNIELCEKFDVDPLEFDGEQDAIFQEYTKSGKKHMEYLVDHGTFDDVPVDFIFENFEKHYPKLIEEIKNLEGQSGNLQDLQGQSLEKDMGLS